jgi:hypothetical protein
MPVHDWTRVNAGIFHDFHTVWLVEIRNRLNAGLLPEGYYALAEQIASETNPDVRLVIRHASALSSRGSGGTGLSPAGDGDARTDMVAASEAGNANDGARRSIHPPQWLLARSRWARTA